MNAASKLLLSVAICFSCNAYTQTDTSTLHLGRIKLKKDFTQSITIKGEYLEKMPFTSLQEAINAWSYGYYASVSNNIAYVIDGVLMNDVNAYSVYDIAEVTLVQNALIQINGARHQQQLALITTRKGRADKQGITIAGQGFLVKGDPQPSTFNPDPSSETNFFHQYHVAAYRNGKSLQYGISANYLRNVVPATKNPAQKTVTPANYDRFRLNGWLTAQLGSNHDLSIHINAVPQVSDAEYVPTAAGGTGLNAGTYKYDSKTTTFNPTITFTSRFGKGFTNEFNAGYNWQKFKGDQKNILAGNLGPDDYYQLLNGSHKTQQVLLTDQVSYHGLLNDNWHIEPSLHFTFRYIKDVYSVNNQTYYNGLPASGGGMGTTLEGRIYLLTPSINLYYKNSFNIQGGLLANISRTNGQDIKKIFPFVTTSLDVLRLTNAHNPTSLQLFASYAQTNNFGDLPTQLTNNAYISSIPPTYVNSGPFALPVTMDPNHTYWIWQAGTRLGILNDRLSVNYQFERRHFPATALVPLPSSYVTVFHNVTSAMHHLGINATVLNKKSLFWLTGINASSIKSKTEDPLNVYTAHTVTGDLNSDKTTWTGGWVNRFSWKQLSAGIDLVYYVNPDLLPTIPGNSKVEAWSIQNVYVAYQLHLKGTKGLEIYADCRNPRRDKDFTITGINKYYGLGFKATL